MKSTLVVVADLGCLKAFRVDDTHMGSSPRLELLEQFDSPDAHEKLVQKVTDFSGRFTRGTGNPNTSAAMSDGERHNIDLEKRKRLVRLLAGRLNALGRNKEVECCLLAASKEINHQLLEGLEPQVRAKITKNLPADLTKLDRGQILSHFGA